jgi:hypothetical protein
MNEPDYKSYSFSELQEALDSIDSERFKARFERLQNEINQRGTGDTTPTKEDTDIIDPQTKKRLSVLFTMFLTIPLMTYGCYDAIKTGEISFKSWHFSLNEQPTLYWFFTGFLAAIILFLFVAVTLAIKDKKF